MLRGAAMCESQALLPGDLPIYARNESIMKGQVGSAFTPVRKKSKKRFDHVILRAWCKSCGICSAFCPKNVIGANDMGFPTVERPDDCIGCRFCELHCPDFAIAVKEREEQQEDDRP